MSKVTINNKDIEGREYTFLSLFTPRTNVYPAKVKGKYRSLKWYLLTLFLGIYYITPWLRWDRGENAPDQAVLIDLSSRKFFFFAIEIWPQEVYIFSGLLIIAAFLLFFMTSLAGRVWCGYACFQTIWTDLFMLVERIVEGDRNKRIARDKKNWGIKTLFLKLLKHGLWLLIAVATGGALVFYFADAHELFAEIVTGKASFTVYFWVGLLTISTYIMAGHAREQVCTYMCPYARFQGAMFDEDTLIVSYDSLRGEPRGKKIIKEAGDCVDCGRCIAVCPTGIDIRDGQQYQCITCALCIDACNNIMEKLGRKLGLIRYDTLRKINARKLGVKPKKAKRLRPVLYFLLILSMGGGIVYTLLNKQMLDINLIRERNPLYIRLADGSIRNIYTMHVINKFHNARNYHLSIVGVEGKIKLINGGVELDITKPVNVTGNSVSTFKVLIEIDSKNIKTTNIPIIFTLKGDGVEDNYKSIFITPQNK